MALTPGTCLGIYEVSAQIGVGGMGEVYRARDTKLGREVALKVLPESFVSDPERIARFQREAKTLASLNHPNIGGIHGLEEANGVTALVLELVEGPTLASRIAQGPIPLDEALPIAKQIAQALEAAHEQGIVHRDLKPANIKVRADGTVKVLDFGLAKVTDAAIGSPADGANSPTITTPAMTHAGVILGTAAYMSPEQARGKTVDRRADIWAFGSVLYEMLTGKRAFPGEDITDTIVSVISKEPNWYALPSASPAGLRRLLMRCLKKDAKARMQAIGDVRVQLEELLSGEPDETPTARGASPHTASARRTFIAAVIVAVLASATIATLATWRFARPVPASLPPMRFVITPPAAQQLRMEFGDRDLALAPDGTRLVYVRSDGNLMIRALDQLDATLLGGFAAARNPFFSPDGRWVAAFTGGVNGSSGELRKVSIAGGSSLLLCRYQGAPRGASWGPDDTIVFATNDPNSGLLRVSAAGGEPEVLTTPDTAAGEADHWFPFVMPGGKAALFTVRAPGGREAPNVAIVDLSSRQRTILVRGGTQPEYVELSSGSDPDGFLVYVLGGTLRAVRFDPRTRTVAGDPVSVIEAVVTKQTGAADFSLSRRGSLVYVPGEAVSEARPRSLVWVTRAGVESTLDSPRRAYQAVRLSPDGTRVALYLADQDQDIWIWDFARRTLVRLTKTPAFDSHPVWTADGRRIIFSSSVAGIENLFWQTADGTGAAERLTTSPDTQQAMAVTSDGARLILQQFASATGSDFRTLRLDLKTGELGQPESLLQTTFNELHGQVSPDGHWLAYQSNDSGQYEVSVRPFPNVNDGHWTISRNGGALPTWSGNGKELFYFDGTNSMMAVPVHTSPVFSTGAPTKLFDARYLTRSDLRSYDVSPDGQRFLMIKNIEGSDQKAVPPSIVVVLNWAEELKRLHAQR